MEYKTELHCHTSEFSGCSDTPGAEAVEKYIANGYTTVVLTNHFVCGARGYSDHAELCHAFYEAADVMRRAAGGRLCVLTGAEVCFKENGNDYLVFGMTEQMATEMTDLFDMGVRAFHEAVKDKGVLVVQAHPFRFGQVMTNPSYVDGIEVFNGHFGWYSHNELAHTWASMWMEKYNRDFILTSGSDHHYRTQKPVGGIVTNTPITTNEELVSALRSHSYRRLSQSLGEHDI